MSNPDIWKYAKPENQFKQGTSGNPGGKPAGARNRIQGDFMRALADDFEEHGKDAIIACRTDKPDQYLKIVASLMPKELEVKKPLEDLTDDELIAGVAALQRLLNAEGTGEGTGHPQVMQ